MKINIEYEQEEYTSLVTMVSGIVDVFKIAVENTHKERMARIQNSRLKTVGSIFESMDEDLEDDDENSSPIHFDVVNGGKEESGPFSKAHKEKLSMSAYAVRGQKAFEKLVAFWAQGFNDPEAEQPERAERCVTLNQSFEGRSIIHYLEYIRSKYPSGGLTYAVRDTGLVANEHIRIFAENMTNVSSACRFTQFASYLEHPDPSQLEDFYNV